MNTKEYQARYQAEHPEKVRLWRKNYYLRHREKMLKKAADYRQRKKAPPNEYPLPSGWNITFTRQDGLWSWSAQKDGARLNAGRVFATLQLARRDCSAAIG